jgi:transposase
MAAACAAIRETLLAARVIRFGRDDQPDRRPPHWHWVFVSAKAVLHQIAPRRARTVAENVPGEHRPTGVGLGPLRRPKQDLAPAHQVCLARVLRDVQYAIDCGDDAFAPRLRALLRWAILSVGVEARYGQ